MPDALSPKNSATSALHDSIKQKAANEKLEKETSAMKAKLLEFSGSEAENKFRVTKEKEDSLKVENLVTFHLKSNF